MNKLRETRTSLSAQLDPFGDVFLDLEQKHRPVLQSIMEHHGLLPATGSFNMSLDVMRDTITDHVFNGHCLPGLSKFQMTFSQKLQNVVHNSEKDTNYASCDDFINSLTSNASDIETHIQLLNNALHKIRSCKTLFQVLQCEGISCSATENLKHLRVLLHVHIKKLEKSNPCSNSHAADIHMGQPITDWPSVAPQSLKDKIIEQFRQETSSEELQTCVCASCSSSVLIKDHITVKKTDMNLTCLQHPETRLSGMPPNLSNIQADDLDVTQLMEGILLDQRGVENNENLFLCKDCYISIKKNETPPLSLANDLLLGDVPPELQDLTPIEESMIARCRAKLCVIQLKAEESVILPNTQRGLRGHIIIYPQKPESLTRVLPPSIEDVCKPICVVFIGSQKPSQDWLRSKARPLIVHRERVHRALLWLKQHNPFYQNIIINEDSLHEFPENDILPVHIQIVDDAQAIDHLTSRYDNMHNPTEASLDDTQCMPTIFDSVIVTGVESDASVNQLRAAAMHHMKVKGGGFLQIPHSDKPANEFYSPELFPMTYPTLFPYGLGGFEDAKRTNALSFKRQVKHFFSLADQRFQKHYSFLFTVFNILQ